jgi:hypothetical protein
VDVPYTPYKLQDGVSLDVLAKDWPHWKNRDVKQTYQSDRILGRLFTRMVAKMKEVSGESSKKDDTALVPVKIRDYIRNWESENRAYVQQLRVRVLDQINEYLLCRKNKPDLTDDERRTLCSSFCENSRMVLIDNESVHKRQVVAAVVYDIAFSMETAKPPTPFALEFAYSVACGEILTLLGESNALSVGRANEHYVLQSSGPKRRFLMS